MVTGVVVVVVVVGVETFFLGFAATVVVVVLGADRFTEAVRVVRGAGAVVVVVVTVFCSVVFEPRG